MATHRKKSAKKRIRTGEFAVAAFLGLAVTAAPAIAAADTSDGSSTGPSAETRGAQTGPKTAKTGKTSAGNGTPLRIQATAAEPEEDDTVLSDPDEGDGTETGAVVDPDTGTDTDAGTGEQAPPVIESGTGTDTTGTEVVEPPAEPEITDPPVIDPVIVDPEVIEAPDTPGTTPVVDVIEIPSSDQSASSLSLKGSDPSPTPTALGSALLDIDLDIVPKPPVIPAFAPLMGIINGLASWVDKVFPPYESSPILNPTQVAGGWVMTLLAGLEGTYWQGQPTPFTFGALVLVTAAYARYERLATNHLPEAPTVSAGPLPLTWKLKSVDPDGDLLVYSVDLSGQPSNGLITMSPDGTFSFIPTSLSDLNDGADVTFTVRVNDSLGMLEHPINPEGNDAFYTVSFRYPGLGINNLPVFTPPGQATVVGTDGTSGKVTISAQATDADGDPLTYTATSLFGTVTRNEDGTFTYTPNAAARHAAAGDLAAALGLNKDVVSIWANDGRGGITLLPTTVTVEIVGANNVPTVTVKPPAISDPLTGLIAGGFDIDDDDNDLVTFSPLALTTSRGGIVTVTGLGYTYLPSIQARSEGGTDTFTVTADDGHGGTVEVSITVTIAKFNLGPVGGITVATPDSDGVVRGQVAATDLNGDTITYKLSGGLSSGYSQKGGIVLLNSDGTFTFIPKPSTDLLPGLTMDSFEVELSDGNGGFATTTVTLFADLKLDPKVTGNAGGVINGGLDIDDNDNAGLLTYSVGTGPNKGTVTVNPDGTYTYTATSAGWNETDSFTIVGTVNGLSITVATVSLVPKPNVAPTSPLLDGATVVGGSGIATGNIGASDANGDTLHYSVTGYGGSSSKVLANGSIVTVDANGKWSYVPGLNSGFLGAIVGSTFTVYVSDGKGGETSTLVTVSTHDLNLPVTTTNGGHGVTTGGVQLTSSEQGVLTYSVGTGPTKGTVTVNPDGTYTYTRTAAGHTGGATDTFQIVGSVGDVSIVVAAVTVNPTLSNVAPTAGTTTITESSLGGDFLGIRTQNGKGKVTAFDADGDAVSYPGGSIIPALYGTANGGSVSFYSDGTFTYTITKTSSYFHAAAANGATGLAVADTFTITVTDSLGASSTIVVSVPVEKLNSTPSSSVSVGSKTTDALGVVRGILSGSDNDDDSLSYTLVGGTNGTAATANGGIIRFSGNSFTYIPTAGKATDSFQVQVTDGHGGVSTATISLTGLGTPSPTTDVNTSTVNVVTGQLNTAGNTGLTYSVGSEGSKGTVTVTSTGAFSYTRTVVGHAQTPGDTFTIRATDADGNSVIIATVNVTPTVSNAAPVAGTTVFTGSSIDDNRILGIGTLKQTTTGTLKATDADGDTVTFAAGSFSTANGGTVVINADGTFTYTIDEGFSYYHGAAKIGATGSAVADSFSATAVDGFGGSTGYSVSVAIYAINSTPTISGGVRALGTVTLINVDDNDGDSLTFSHNGSSFTFGGRGLATSTLWNGSRLTVTDGYYVTVNGVVTGTPSTVTKTW